MSVFHFNVIMSFLFVILCNMLFELGTYLKTNNMYLAFLCYLRIILYSLISVLIVEIIFCHTYTVIYLRKFLYQRIKNKRFRRYLDSIFFIKYYLFYWDSRTYQHERRKNYIFASLTFPLTLVILILSWFAWIIRYILMMKKSVQKYKNMLFFTIEQQREMQGLEKIPFEYDDDLFNFEKLPSFFHYRFFELQSPLIKKRFKQIYPGIKYDHSIIDKLHIDAELYDVAKELVDFYNKFVVLEEIEWENISEAWNFGQLYFEIKKLLVVRFWNARKNGWNLEYINNFKIIKTAIFTKLQPLEFQHLYNNLNLAFISELQIKYSNLTLNELALIKELKLKSIILSIKLENNSTNNKFQTIEFMMEIFETIPKIRVFFDCYYGESYSVFENFLVDWIIKNGYREYFSFTFRTHSFPWYLTFSGNSLIINGFDCYQLSL